MVKAYDVPADMLIERLVEEFKKDQRFKPPEWAYNVKTGSHKERLPQDDDWWYYRLASILRKVYLYGPISVKDLRREYGGRKQRGMKPSHRRDAGGAIIRNCLHMLESAGYIQKTRLRTKAGNEIDGPRVITADGMRLVDRLAKEVHDQLVKQMPELAKYA